jgi:hypothetical protein
MYTGFAVACRIPDTPEPDILLAHFRVSGITGKNA